MVADQLGRPFNKIDIQSSYFELGLTSHQLLRLAQEIRSTIDDGFSPASFFEYPTISSLISHLAKNYATIIDHLAIRNTNYPISELESENALITDNRASLPKKGFSNSDSTEGKISPIVFHNQTDRYKPFPLSDIQESFLSGRKLSSGGGVGCHIYLEMEMKDLSIYRLDMAWKRLVDYHEMLRAVILPNGQQKILKQTPPYEFRVIDLRLKSKMDQLEYLERLRERMSHKVYELDQWPLFEIRISNCPDKTIVHFSIDELIVDAFSLEMLFQQWWQLYKQPDFKFDKLKISFRDYILAIKKFEDSREYNNDLEFWLKKLENMPQGPQLPLKIKFDNPANPKNHLRIRLKGTLAKKEWTFLKKKVEALNVSPSVLLFNVFTEVLRHWCIEKTFSVIFTFFNRLIHPQLDQILGPFISTNIFVVGNRGECDFQRLMQDTQKVLFHDLGHSSVSGIRVLRELKKRRKISKSVSLPVVFTSLLGQKRPDGEESFLEKVSFSVTQTPQVYLDHQIYEYNGELRFSWDIAKNYYAPGVIDKLFSDYCRSLRILASNFDQWITEIWKPDVRRIRFLKKNSLKEENVNSIDRLPANLFSKAVLEDLKLEFYPNDRFKSFPLTDQQQAYAFGRSKYSANVSSQAYMCFEAENLKVKRLEKSVAKSNTSS